jgi:hypothetical protein
MLESASPVSAHDHEICGQRLGRGLYLAPGIALDEPSLDRRTIAKVRLDEASEFLRFLLLP